ncbi:VOC family protein [Ornithinimicrobium tianjinense]|uniref:VOC family protein n=1 Tax=Ornithinimicrobium tianjinense TaxID=1195761 RepID=A0A917BN09_9MICO|nr:VOC family protein [Ornithinimicrobium tianjinense]GGF47049.1 VOC family protein [Ornithinimicrobium tianjinense]
MATLGTCLWFDGQAREAAEFYTSIFPRSRIVGGADYLTETPSEKAVGSEMTVDFELDGRPFLALNGGPQFTFNEAVSIVVRTQGQEETDRYWESLLEGGGEPSACGWLKDRFGLSWQVVPEELDALLSDPDPDRARRAMQAMLGQVKIDIAEIQAAAG